MTRSVSLDKFTELFLTAVKNVKKLILVDIWNFSCNHGLRNIKIILKNVKNPKIHS